MVLQGCRQSVALQALLLWSLHTSFRKVSQDQEDCVTLRQPLEDVQLLLSLIQPALLSPSEIQASFSLLVLLLSHENLKNCRLGKKCISNVSAIDSMNQASLLIHKLFFTISRSSVFPFKCYPCKVDKLSSQQQKVFITLELESLHVLGFDTINNVVKPMSTAYFIRWKL